jgi:hypothetical protein
VTWFSSYKYEASNFHLNHNSSLENYLLDLNFILSGEFTISRSLVQWMKYLLFGVLKASDFSLWYFFGNFWIIY